MVELQGKIDLKTFMEKRLQLFNKMRPVYGDFIKEFEEDDEQKGRDKKGCNSRVSLIILPATVELFLYSCMVLLSKNKLSIATGKKIDNDNYKEELIKYIKEALRKEFKLLKFAATIVEGNNNTTVKGNNNVTITK